MTTMNITRTGEDDYHVEVKGRFVEEDVDGPKLLGMLCPHNPDCEGILASLDEKEVGYKMEVAYH